MQKPAIYQTGLQVVELLDALYYMNYLEAQRIKGYTAPERGVMSKLPDGSPNFKERMWSEWCEESEFGNDRYFKIWASSRSPEDIEKYNKEQAMKLLIKPNASSWEREYFSTEAIAQRVQAVRDNVSFFEAFKDQTNTDEDGNGEFILGYMSW